MNMFLTFLPLFDTIVGEGGMSVVLGSSNEAKAMGEELSEGIITLVSGLVGVGIPRDIRWLAATSSKS